MSVSDDQLRQFLAAATEGDNRALGELVRQTQPMVWWVCTALGTRGEEADLVQETYLRAMRSLGGYRGDAPVLAWLLAVARNVCADDVRRRRRRRRLMDRLTTEAREQHAPAHQMIGDVVDQLDDDRREAFVLTQYVGLSYEEAAAVLDCPIGTVRSRVSRARGDLAEIVALADIG
jgi:RNA polymerase sigma-70 factor (ECF subfamily)